MRNIAIILTLAVLAASCAKKVETLGPFDPAADLERGNERLEAKYEEEARRIFENIIRLDNTGEYAPLAHLRIADSYVVEGYSDLAIDEYRDFLRTYPRHKYASYAQYQIGLVYFNLIKGPDRGYSHAIKARDAFVALNVNYPRNPYRQEAELKIRQCQALIAEYEFMVGEFYFDKQACKGAVGRLEIVRDSAPDFKDMPKLLYMLAVCYESTGRTGDSDSTVAEIKERYPSSKYIKKARKEIKKIRAAALEKDGKQ